MKRKQRDRGKGKRVWLWCSSERIFSRTVEVARDRNINLDFLGASSGGLEHSMPSINPQCNRVFASNIPDQPLVRYLHCSVSGRREIHRNFWSSIRSTGKVNIVGRKLATWVSAALSRHEHVFYRRLLTTQPGKPSRTRQPVRFDESRRSSIENKSRRPDSVFDVAPLSPAGLHRIPLSNAMTSLLCFRASIRTCEMCTYFSVSFLGLVVSGRLFLELVRWESMETALVILQNIPIYFNVLDNTR